MPTGFGQTRSTSQHGVYRMVFRARDEQVARVALAEGHRLLMAAINNDPFDRRRRAAARSTRSRPRSKTATSARAPPAIVGAATDRGIPHMRLNSGNLVQLGYGANQQRIWTAETDYTSAIGESIASDKELTKSLLASCGVPVPEGQVVANAEEAWEAAEDIGLPVVVKPSDANHGRGVSLELTTREEVIAAFAVAEPEGSDVMVERFIRGHEHRLLVVGGQVVAAARGEIITVTGDGQATRARTDRQPAQQRPAPRRRRRVSARRDRDRHRRQAAARTQAPGTGRQRRAGRRPRGHDPAQRQHGHRLHRPGPPRSRARRRAGRARGGPRHRRHRPRGARHFQAAGPAARRDRRSQRRPRPADAPEAGRRLAAPGGPRHLRPPVPQRRTRAAFPWSAWPARATPPCWRASWPG